MKAFVLLTAMPPTTGHLQLIQFASSLVDEGVEVILNTQPIEPFPEERYRSIVKAVRRVGLENWVNVNHYSEMIEQNPEAPGFWGMWEDMLFEYGIRPGKDIIVASETYGKKLAEITETKFFPYDIARHINYTKATNVREYPLANFKDILPEFQEFLKITVTFFGAESIGKTTTSKYVAERLGAPWLFEYARPYLENTINKITVESMEDIWRGQKALQIEKFNYSNTSPYIIQDTDLYSTVGYWNLPHWEKTLGKCPPNLSLAASILKSDLYIILKSNIPFEEDPLRYGGDVREGSDQYWIDICEKNNLNYIVLDSSNFMTRASESITYIRDVAAVKFHKLRYDRHNL